uniref:Uncharacterized protein n=1 Tax=Magallana gigas TaxID=29159 RepID=K1RV73_MAGGI
MFTVITDRTITLPSNDFRFKFVVYADCPGVPKDVIMESDKDSEELSKAAELEAAQTMNMILGIVTAGCFCVVFLIFLVITYCYFRNNPDLKRRHHSVCGAKLNSHGKANISIIRLHGAVLKS